MMTDYWSQIYFGEAIHICGDGLDDEQNVLARRLREVERKMGKDFAHRMEADIRFALRDTGLMEFREGVRLGVGLLAELTD